jgi:hypothetical protein
MPERLHFVDDASHGRERPDDRLLICGVSTLASLKSITTYPRIVDDLRDSFARLEGLPCEVFLAPYASLLGCHIFASWNQIDWWLRQVEGLRRVD